MILKILGSMSFSTKLELVSLTIHPLAYHWGEGHNYTVGITPFADLTRSEFRSRYGAPQQNARHKHTDSLRHPADFGRFSCVFLEENQSHQKAGKGPKYQPLTAFTSMNLLILSLWNLPIYQWFCSESAPLLWCFPYLGACCDEGAFGMANFWINFPYKETTSKNQQLVSGFKSTGGVEISMDSFSS